MEFSNEGSKAGCSIDTKTGQTISVYTNDHTNNKKLKKTAELPMVVALLSKYNTGVYSSRQRNLTKRCSKHIS
jgi:hypothetical protein